MVFGHLETESFIIPKYCRWWVGDITVPFYSTYHPAAYGQFGGPHDHILKTITRAMRKEPMDDLLNCFRIKEWKTLKEIFEEISKMENRSCK